jgi:hypothetical protein
MTQFRYLRLSLFCWLLLSAVARGQLIPTERARLRDEVAKAAANLDANRFPDAAVAVAELKQRVQDVDQYLSRATDADNREAWKRYIHIDPLIQALDQDAPASELLAEATAVRDRLIGTAPGLELTAITRLRDALDELISSLLFRNREQSMAMVKTQLDSLAEMLQQADDSPTSDQFNAISSRVGLLESSRQAPELVRTLQAAFNQPNVAIMIGSTLVQQAIDRPVVRDRPVRDCILGTRLIGTALLQGQVAASLLPSSNSARIELTLSGSVSSDNTGFNGPVRLKTVGLGQVLVSRTMTVDEAGFRLGETRSEADLSTKITSIQHNLAIVRKIARKQAAKKKPAADRVAREKLRKQVQSQFESESSGLTPTSPAELLDRAQPMLHRLSLNRPTQQWSSTSQAICIESIFRRDDQLSTIVPRPEVPVPFALATQIHESAVENAFSVILAGRTLNKQRLNDLLEETGRVQREEPSQDAETFEISFSRSRPVIFEARNGSLRIGLRGTKFAQGDRTALSKAMEITAIYEPVVRDDGRAVLQRTGNVDVDFPRERLTVREVGLKPIIQKEFSQIFPEQILDQPLQIGQDAKVETLRGRAFKPSQVQAADGWLTIAFQ